MEENAKKRLLSPENMPFSFNGFNPKINNHRKIEFHLFKLYRVLFIVVFLLAINCPAQEINDPVTPEMFAMPRSQMYLEDTQVVLFNGIGSVNPRQFSITGLTNLKFYPIDIPDYEFYFNFLDHKSKELIQDDTPALWKNWVENGTGTDPLGANFRPGFANLIVTQDETWQPNQYHRKGVFHKKFKTNWVSFGIESLTRVSGAKDEVLLKLMLTNYDSKELDLTLIPNQKAERLTLPSKKGSSEVKVVDPFVISSEQLRVGLVSDIAQVDEKGFRITLAPKERKEFYFAIQPSGDLSQKSERYQPDIKERFERAYKRTVERLNATFQKLPKVKTEHKGINELYKRCALTLNECKWERTNFIIDPFWASGTWPISMIWDQCFAEQALAMIDPKGLKESIKLTLRESRMKQSYIFWNGPVGNILYIQDPFALQTTIDSYITFTGDKSILDEVAGDATIYEWMKRWAFELRKNYSRPDGLIDVGFSTEKIIEIRTDGYNHVVPVVNGLTAVFYKWMYEMAHERGDKDAKKFREWYTQIDKAFHEKLWNDKLGWFDNLYPDDSKASNWTYHLLDLLETDELSYYEKSRLAGHIVDGEFLAKYGMYSISKSDTLHWDRIDADFGGGGQYIGMTLRIAKSLLENGFHAQGFEILKRFSKYTEHFPYFTHNPWSDKFFQDRSSMALQISAGAGIEAIITGIFGLAPQKDGSLIIDPAYDQELGRAELKGFKFRNANYDVLLQPFSYLVKKNGKLLFEKKYGEKAILNLR